MKKWVLLLLLCLLPTTARAVTTTDGVDTYLVETFPMPATPGTSPLPLDIAIDGATGNTVYMVAEFDNQIYSVARTAADGTTMTAIPILAPGQPLFRNNLSGADTPSFYSFQQERILTTSDGSVWVSQGGNIFYSGTGNNWSRIMRRFPDGSWNAYTLPLDAGGAVGFAVTDPPALLWVMAAGDNAFYVTRLRGWHEGEVSATRYPPVDYRWTKIAGFGVGAQLLFPAQVIRLKDRRLAGTSYFGTSFFIYDPISGAFTTIALPAVTGTTANSSGPWQICQDANESLWIAEDYAQRVTRYNIFTGIQTQFDFSGTLGSNEHPHSILCDPNGSVYVTTYSLVAGGDARLIKIASNGTITYGTSWAAISLAGGLTGIVRDSTGKYWISLFRQTKAARLTKQ